MDTNGNCYLRSLLKRDNQWVSAEVVETRDINAEENNEKLCIYKKSQQKE